MRTNSEPASASALTCATVAATSAVSVLVIDWTTIGAPPPIAMPPTSVVRVAGECAEPGRCRLRSLLTSASSHGYWSLLTQPPAPGAKAVIWAVSDAKCHAGFISSLLMLPMPWPSLMVAPLVAPDRLTKNASSDSNLVSPLMVTETVWVH